jgi:hypothetical protein
VGVSGCTIWFSPDVPAKESDNCIASLEAGGAGGLSDSGILCSDKG